MINPIRYLRDFTTRYLNHLTTIDSMFYILNDHFVFLNNFVYIKDLLFQLLIFIFTLLIILICFFLYFLLILEQFINIEFLVLLDIFNQFNLWFTIFINLGIYIWCIYLSVIWIEILINLILNDRDVFLIVNFLIYHLIIYSTHYRILLLSQ